jgi:hypothetical protein
MHTEIEPPEKCSITAVEIFRTMRTLSSHIVSYPGYGSLLLPRKYKTEFEFLAKGKCAPNPEP